MADQASFAIGVDLGATKIAAALVSRDGTIVHSSRVDTIADEGAAAVLDRIALQIQGLVRRSPGSIRGIGVGVAGIIDPSRGIVCRSVNLKWENLELVSELKSRLGLDLPISLEKDTCAATLGEQYYGSGKDCPNFVYLGIGSGLGGGAVAEGTLIAGAGYYAMGVGHLSLDPDGIVCACGQRGCAETIVSGRGLLALVRRLVDTGRYPALPLSLDRLATRQVIEMAAAGNPLALDALTEMGRTLGIVIAVIASVLNPSKVVVGGGLGLAAFPWIVPPATAELRRRLMPHCYLELELVKSSLASSAIGAASLVWHEPR